MGEYKDLETMIEIISLAIVRQQTEEEFFRRSASSSTNRVAKDLFLEIADNFSCNRKSLEERRDRILTALNDLRKAGKGKRAEKKR